jgi:hypothetical protein
MKPTKKINRIRIIKQKSKINTFFDENDILFWSDLWKGMPEFIQTDIKPYKTIIVHFKSQEDIINFSKLIKQNITKKTRSIYFPKNNISKYINKRYIDES